jgi:transposase
MSPYADASVKEVGVGRTPMSAKEVRRAEVLSRVRDGKLTVKDAATLLGVSYRQGKRLWKRYRRRGAKGLVHKNVGHRSNRSLSAAFWKKVLETYAAKYGGDEETRFGPTLGAEHLAKEDKLVVTADTLRRHLLQAGLWTPVRKRRGYRRRRERKAHFGELLQLDGSFEKWLEDRGPVGCLMDLVDDATGTSLLRFEAQETTWAAVHILRAWLERYGVPHALYTDWKTVYLREPTERELIEGTVPRTQFGRMCECLGIRIIGANSPQAKGRVERNHGTHQDRLIKKLRRLGIADYRAANVYLDGSYIDDHNARFARVPAAAGDFHLPLPAALSLDSVFQLEQTRTISNDWVVRYENRIFQVARQSRFAPALAKVLVRQSEAGVIELVYRGQVLQATEITGCGQPRREPSPARPRIRTPRRSARPAADHPWRQDFRRLPDRASDGESIPGHIPVLLGTI